MARVMIVDDHPAIRMATRILLEGAGHTIIDEVDNGVDAIRISRMKAPDLILLDIGIPMLDGFEVINRLIHFESPPFIIVLSAQVSDHIILRCYQAGAVAFFSKLDDFVNLVGVVDDVLNGMLLFPDRFKLDLTLSENLLATLSDREMTVFTALCQGKANKAIAADMLLSEKTISTYKRRLMNKLQVKNLIELLSIAKQHNSIS